MGYQIHKKIKSTFHEFGIYAFVLIIAYFPILIAQKTVSPDSDLVFLNLEKVNGFFHYFKMLFSYQLYDFQPIRDIFLYLEKFVFELLNINISIHLNILFFTVTAIFLSKTLQLKYFLERSTSLMYTCLFIGYPLFCATLSWGFAKKHLLSLMFIVMATYYLIELVKKNKLRNSVYIFVLYGLANLSQPINILWIFWAFIYLYNHGKKYLKCLIPNLITFALISYWNFSYYQNSLAFQKYFESKTESVFNISTKILGLGHYTFMSIWPYEQALSYSIGHWTVMLGITLLVLMTYLLIKFSSKKKETLIWLIYAVLPLTVILSNPKILSDNYLITPAIGIFIILVNIIEKFNLRTLKSFQIGFIVLLTFFIIYTNKESRLWLNPIKFAKERNFERRPNCDSAINLAMKIYTINGVDIDNELKNFILSNKCLSIKSKQPLALMLKLVYLFSYMNYFDGSKSFEEKEISFKKLEKFNFYPSILFANYLYEKGFKKRALEKIYEVYSAKSDIEWKSSARYDTLLSHGIGQYCRRVKDRKCMSILDNYSKTTESHYY